jgi:hypothetical protein
MNSTEEGAAEKSFERHIPSPEDFYPLYLRREFLLDNGQRVIVASRDMEKNWDNEIFFVGDTTARVVRELTGFDKSPPFQLANHTIDIR